MKIAETFEKICKRIVSSPKRTHNSCSLQPITFDTNVHGDNVKISTDGLLAKRNQSFCKAIVFSNRALLIGEEISIVVTSVSDSWSGSLRFGFCNKNPLNLKSKLPKYMCPDLTSVPGCFARALQDDETKIGTLLTFWLNEHGQIMYRVNNKLRGVFLNVEYPHINVPMWAMIDVYGLVTSVKIISGDSFMISSKKALSTRSINDLTMNFNNFNLNENTFSSSPQHWPVQNNPINFSTTQHSKPVSKYYANVNFNRMQLSETVGANIKLNNSRTIASRKLLTANQGYVFTKRPLNSNEKLVIQILKADPLFNGNLGFGLTTCNPLTLNSNDLPEDSHNLLNRPEYWLVIKDVLVNAKTGDELGFMINNSNQVQLTKNDLPPVTLMHVDSTQNFYAFFDLHGKTTKIQVLGTYQEQQRLSFPQNQMQLQIQLNNYNQNLTQANRSNRFSELNQLNNSISCKKIFQSLKSNKPQQQIKLINSNSKLDQETQNVNGECTICFEKSINCVLYQCGHCCMCYDCAIRLYANAGARCPICRASIQDVIRTYWS